MNFVETHFGNQFKGSLKQARGQKLLSLGSCQVKSLLIYAWFAVFDWAVESVVNQIWIVYRQNSTVVYSLARE